MSQTALIVSAVSLLGWLLLNLRSVEMVVERHGRAAALKMALAWAAIIGLVAWIATVYPA